MQEYERTRTEISRLEISRLLDDWNTALLSRDPKQVVTLYAPDALLLPTLSKKLRKTPDMIEDYFTEFLQLAPKGTVIEENIRIHDPIAINSGIYSFATKISGKAHDVTARFTFVYRRDETGWKIIEHHSSTMPGE